MQEIQLKDFPIQTFDKVRYADTDRQGHVNNTAFSMFLETGRVEILYNPEVPLLAIGASYVIASLHLEFLREITWPGRVDIGTGILKIGNSSITIFQQLFQAENCVAKAETIVVQVDNTTGRSKPLTGVAKQFLNELMLLDVSS